MSGALPEAHSDDNAPAAVAPAPVTFDLRARAVETGVLVASIIVLRLLGLLLLVVSSYRLGSVDALYPFVAMVADPNLLAWIALTAAVQFGLRSMRRSGRWALIVLAAPVAVLLATTLRSIPSLALSGPAAVLGNGIAWVDAGILTAVVALGLVFPAAFLGRERRTSARVPSVERRTSARVAGALLALGGLLALVLVWQAFETYFTLFGSQPVVTPAQETRYLVTASLTLAALVGAIVFAAVSRRRGLIIASSIVGCLGLIIAFAVPVPADRFRPEPPPPPAEHHYAPCFGEGDPNCVGG
jgi:hypothetical protein